VLALLGPTSRIAVGLASNNKSNKMPKPVLQAMVLAEHVYRDGDTGKFLIIGTMGKISAGEQIQATHSDEGIQLTKDVAHDEKTGGEQDKVPMSDLVQAGSPHLYLALTGVHGTLALQLHLVDLDDDGKVLLNGEVPDISASDPLTIVEFSVPMPAPRFWMTKTGTYSIDVLYDGELLGTWPIRLEESSQSDETE
jgi:hypothetical protein